MIRLRLFLLLIYSVFSFQGYSDIHFKSETPQSPFLQNNNQTVYVCTGSYAYAYHSRSNCNGLNNCKGEIKYTDEYYARTGLNRKPCCICWSNVIGDCKNDNTEAVGSGGAGGNGSNNDALAAVGIAIIAGSAAILSNDFYLHNNFNFANKEVSPLSIGLGFRKLLKESAIEYGLILGDNVDYQLSYLHKIHSSKKSDRFNVFLGPSLNYVDQIGFGGLLSSQYTLGKVVKLDVRYELTSQSHRISLGFIFHYQDKYFWQR
ncbi:hypothetical protein U8591_06495 [Aquirufa antheringensis]